MVDDYQPKQVGHYRILSLIGQGGMADVYLGEHIESGRQVAVKVLPDSLLRDKNFIKRFKQEIKTTIWLEHPRILPVYEVGQDGRTPFIVMRYMPHGSLFDRIQANPDGLPLDETIRLVEQIADGLQYAHDKGIIHRDFKPANALLDDRDNIYITDFGLAKATEESIHLTGSGNIAGTPAYMAPELASPEGLSLLVDVYALGITTFEMLSGRQPYEAPTPMGVLMAHLGRPIPQLKDQRPDLPDSLQRVIERGMAKDPADRYQTILELAEELREAATDRATTPASKKIAPMVQVEEVREEVVPPPVENVAPVAPQTPHSWQPTPAQVGAPLPVRSEQTALPAKSNKGRGCLLWAGGAALLFMGGVIGVVILFGLSGGIVGAVYPPDDGNDSSTPAGNTPGMPETEVIANSPVPTERPAPSTDRPASLPTDIPTDIPTPIPTTQSILPGYPGNPVERNADWTRASQSFGGVEMALVPVGCFEMGNTSGDDDEYPTSYICFDQPFWIDIREVTNAQYGSSGQWSEPNRPRETVTWFEADAHCTNRGGRLPTEAEWEYAARGPDSLIYPWGNTFSSSRVAADNKASSNVGSIPEGASWVGALDMSGNVWEWVNSVYLNYPYDEHDGRERDGNADPSSIRAARGGGWVTYEIEFYMRASVRTSASPYEANYLTGFRCMRTYNE